MGKVFLAGVLGVFAGTLAISFAVPVSPKDDRPLGDDTINFEINVKLSFNRNGKKLEESTSQEGTSTSRSVNQDITVKKEDTGNHGNARRLVMGGSGNRVVNGDVNGGVTLSGAARLTIHGNVDGGVLAGGAGNLSIDRNVRGGIKLTGSRTMNVDGDVSGDIDASGSSTITVRGRHLWGSLTKSGSAQVHILNEHVPK